jgi:hypothetical protein
MLMEIYARRIPPRALLRWERALRLVYRLRARSR